MRGLWRCGDVDVVTHNECRVEDFVEQALEELNLQGRRR